MNERPADDPRFDDHWHAHRDGIRRFLIGLTRDLDLAEDLLQDTYVHAHSGFARYHGGEMGAWLQTIARNCYFSHRRRRSIQVELLDEDTQSIDASSDHDGVLALREGIAGLPSDLRNALLMRHYGEMTYQEIAEKLVCPVGTAKWRVSTAIRRLRGFFEVEQGEKTMRCAQCRGARLLDYLNGVLPAKQAAAMERHLAACAGCREEADIMRQLVRTLDVLEGEYKTHQVVELDACGTPVIYSWASMVNRMGCPMAIMWWTVNKEYDVVYTMLQGEETPVEQQPLSAEQFWYEIKLPHLWQPGERIDTLLVFRSNAQQGCAEDLGDGRWRFAWQTSPNTGLEWVYALGIRLPDGARLLRAEPPPTETPSHDGLILSWRKLLSRITERPADGSQPFQFTCEVEYMLDSGQQCPTARAITEMGKTVMHAPEEVLRIHDLSYVGDGNAALALYHQVAERPFPYPRAWFRLGLMLYDGAHNLEALDAFHQAAQPGRAHPVYIFAAYVWQGHLLDLLGRRNEALQCYQAALAPVFDHSQMSHDQYDMRIDRQWVEQRLQTPFTNSFRMKDNHGV